MRGSLETLKLGDHAILLYRSRTEQFDSVIPYVRLGLARKERCLYIAGDTSVSEVITRLEQAGINVVAAERARQLIIAPPEGTYLKDGIFEPERMVEGLKEEVERALADGFAGLRGSGELGWAAGLPSALLRLYEYEALFDAALSKSFLALCQYNEKLFSAEVLGQLLRIHPKVFARGAVVSNPYYVGPGNFLSRHHAPLKVDDLLMAG
jgi:hypothetical protein